MKKKSRKIRKMKGGAGGDNNSFSLDNGGLWKVYLPPYNDLELVKQQTKMMAEYLMKKQGGLLFNAKFNNNRIKEIIDSLNTSQDPELLKTNFMEIQLMYCIFYNSGSRSVINLGAAGSFMNVFGK